MKEYLQIHDNRELKLPAALCQAAKLPVGDLLEACVEENGSIRLVPKSAQDRKLVERPQLISFNWASKQKQGAKK